METLDEHLMDVPENNLTKRKYLPLLLLLIMLIGGVCYFKFLTSEGARGSLYQSFIASVLMLLFCLLINVVTVLIGRFFSSQENKVSIKTKAFWTARITGGFINWCIIIGLILVGKII